MTDEHSTASVASFLAHTVTRRVGLGAVQARGWRWRRYRGFPRLKISFVDIKHIVRFRTIHKISKVIQIFTFLETFLAKKTEDI